MLLAWQDKCFKLCSFSKKASIKRASFIPSVSDIAARVLQSLQNSASALLSVSPFGLGVSASGMPAVVLGNTLCFSL